MPMRLQAVLQFVSDLSDYILVTLSVGQQYGLQKKFCSNSAIICFLITLSKSE